MKMLLANQGKRKPQISPPYPPNMAAISRMAAPLRVGKNSVQ